MHLRSLRLSGFKTFAHPSEFVLSPGVTAIVGPNGSGKSNVVDALRWVLGETNARDLRGRRMEDVIFHGGARRARAGFAEVSLVLDNSSGLLPLEYREVSITRRVERGGDAEYLVNGSRARLRDVEELLAATGLGTEGYAIVAQNDIDFIIEATPAQRRALLEQAAGVLGLRTRRDDALKRLEDAGRSLERLTDVRAELRPRVAELERQAERALRAGELEREITHLQGSLLRDQWRQARVRVDRCEARARQLESRRERAEGELTSAREALEGARGRLAAAHERRLESERRTALARLELERRQHTLELAEGRRAGLSAELHRAEAAIATQGRDLEDLEARLRAGRQAAGVLTAELDRATAALAELGPLQGAADPLEEAARSLAARLLEMRRETETARVQLGAARDRREEYLAAAVRCRSAASEAEAQLEAASRELEAAEAARLRAVEERRSAEGRTAAATAAHEEAQAAAAEARRQLAEADAELGGLTTRLETLRELAAALQREGRPLEGLLQVPAGLELAAQAALERWLGAEIAPDERSAVQSHASEHRKRLVWPVTAGRGRPPKGTQPLADLVGPGSAGTQVRDMLLGRVFLAPDLATAEAALRHLPEGGLLVTRDGDALAPGWLARGPFSPSPLTLLGDQRRLEDAHAGLARSRDDLVRRVSAAEAALGEAGAALEGASAAFAQAQELERRCAEEEHRARLSLEAGRERQSRENERAARDEAAAGAMDGEIANLSSRLDSLAADLERLVAEERASADRLAASREQRQRLASELDQRARARAEAQARVEANDREMVAADQAAGRLRERLSEARGEFSALETRLREAERSVEAGRAALLAQPAAEEPHVRAEELTLEQANHLARQAEDAHLRASVDLASIVTAQEQAAEELERARVELAEARGRMGEDDLAEIEDGDGSVDWRRVQREVTRRQRELAELGPVNALAPALLERDSARLSLIESQHDDVAGSRAALLRLAGELREVIGSRFDAVLGAVGWHFQETFGELFDGGQSSLRLTEGPAEEQGIEIVAQPPGKRAQALSLLSGGERAMTCLAFIFALEQVNPSPFYVFDEVDAALDDTRVTRFARLLKRLSQDRQFIVVTHNHHTMAQADVLYGITAADSGVSQVLTVTLEDASSHRVGAQTA